MAKIRSDTEKGVLALVLLAFVFASMGVFARYLGTGFTILQQVYLRIFVALVCAIVIFRKKLNVQKLSQAGRREWLVLIFRGVISYGIAVPMATQAVIDSKLGDVSFLATLPFVALFGFLFFKEKLTVIKVALILLALSGVGLITIRSFSHPFTGGRGEILAILAGALFSLSYVTRKWHTQLFNNQEITVLMFLFGVTSTFLFSVLHGDGLPQHWTGGLISVIAIAGLANVANLFLTNYGFEHVKAVVAGNILTLESLFAIVIGYAFYNEQLGWREWLGGIMIIASVILMNKYASDD